LARKKYWAGLNFNADAGIAVEIGTITPTSGKVSATEVRGVVC